MEGIKYIPMRVIFLHEKYRDPLFNLLKVIEQNL